MVHPISGSGDMPDDPHSLKGTDQPVYQENLNGLVQAMANEEGSPLKVLEESPKGFLQTIMGGQFKGWLTTLNTIMNTLHAPANVQTAFSSLWNTYSHMQGECAKNPSAPDSAYAGDVNELKSCWGTVSSWMEHQTNISHAEFDKIIQNVLNSAKETLEKIDPSKVEKDPSQQNLIFSANGQIAFLSDLSVFTDSNRKDDYISFAPLRAIYEDTSGMIAAPTFALPGLISDAIDKITAMQKDYTSH